MIEFSLYNPVELFFGVNSLEKVGESAKRFGTKAFVITGKESAFKYGYIEKLKKSLEGAGIKEIYVCRGVGTNPEDGVVNEISDLVVRGKYDFIVALGSGSVLDVAKAVSVVSSNEGYAWDYVLYPEGPRAVPFLNRPVICIPTTAGTGSEVDRYSVISNPKRKEKMVISHSLLYPKVSFVDPALTATLPPKLTALTAMDAFFHALESLTNKVDHPVAEMFSVKALELIKRWLPVAFEEPENLKAREALSLAATYGGYAIDMCRVALIHGMEHPLSAHYPSITHPEGLCALSLYVTKFNLEGVTKDKYATAVEVLGYGNNPYRIMDALIHFLENFGLPMNLKEFGVEKSSLEKMAEDTHYLYRRLLLINPREADLEDIYRIYEKAYEGEI